MSRKLVYIVVANLLMLAMAANVVLAVEETTSTEPPATGGLGTSMLVIGILAVLAIAGLMTQRYSGDE